MFVVPVISPDGRHYGQVVDQDGRHFHVVLFRSTMVGRVEGGSSPPRPTTLGRPGSTVALLRPKRVWPPCNPQAEFKLMHLYQRIRGTLGLVCINRNGIALLRYMSSVRPIEIEFADARLKALAG